MTRRTRSAAYGPCRAVALALLACIAGECRSARSSVDLEAAFPGGHPTLANSDPADPNVKLASRDPLAFLGMCRDRYLNTIQDYRCRFIKFEPVLGDMIQEQEMEVLFREDPFSVEMNWLRGADKAQRITFVKGRWTRDGKQLAHIEPAGLLSLLAPNGVKRDIYAPDVRAASRRTIDQFGFKNTLELIIKFAEMARTDPRYSFRFVGVDEFEGRPSYVLERRLPYTSMDNPYPDRLLVMYIDREWLVPTACYAYADDNRKQLLGSYLTTNIEFNVGLTDTDF